MPLAPSDALEGWKSAQSRLASSIQDYTDACTVLENSIRDSAKDDETLSQLDQLLPGLSKHETALRNARLGIAKTRNPSHATTPIHKLHSELLTIIFTLASRAWVSEDLQELGDDPVSATTLASVCSSWRQLLLRSPVFWSYIEIVLSGPSSAQSYERASLWAERAQSAPLWLTIRDMVVDVYDVEREPSEDALPESDISKIVQFATPLMPFVRTLSICIHEFLPAPTVFPLLSCWIEHGSTEVAERLELRIDVAFPELEVPAISPNIQSPLLSRDKLSQFLKSLRSVYTENIVVDWDHAPYTGLTDLSVDIGPKIQEQPTTQQLSRFLTSSPDLRSLAFLNLFVLPGGLTQSPVALDYLETLRVEATSNRDTASMLSLISSSSPAIRMALTISPHPEGISTARSFFSRTNITLLYLHGMGFARSTNGESPLGALFTHMPHLHTLTLLSCNVSTTALNEFSQWKSSSNRSETPWPALRTLNLLSCRTTPNIVRQFLEIQGCQTLGLFEPQALSVLPSWTGEWASWNVRDEFERELMQKGIEMVWYSPSGVDVPSWTFTA
ncbi:hypothetical protein RhiJN_25099 [Ceratobasidium sp. AG-Ba]|nr:hypothetical protein RhiJN_25099 [Ceratobasidium sp. AG-Ba]